MSRSEAGIPRFLTNMASDVWGIETGRRGTKTARSGDSGRAAEESADQGSFSDGKGLQPDSPSRRGVVWYCVMRRVGCGGWGWGRRGRNAQALSVLCTLLRRGRWIRVGNACGQNFGASLSTPPIKQTANLAANVRALLCPTMHLPTPGSTRLQRALAPWRAQAATDRLGGSLGKPLLLIRNQSWSPIPGRLPNRRSGRMFLHLQACQPPSTPPVAYVTNCNPQPRLALHAVWSSAAGLTR
jgi:hypothetical protein